MPYSKENLHKMAQELGIKRCWYREKGKMYHPHYDIPIRRVDEIKEKCEVVSFKTIVKIIKGEL